MPVGLSGRVLLLSALISLVVAACGPRQPAEPPPAPKPQPAPQATPAPPVDDQSRLSRLDSFCGALQRIVDAEANGFQGLRGEPAGPRSWRGTVVPTGLSGCTVQGDSHPGAQYVCIGPRAQRGNGSQVLESFRQFGADLDACLGRAVWFPRNWQRGDLIEFAGIEQQQVWRDLSPTPRPVVALNIDEDILNRIYSIRFAVSTFR
jgi:hypothetical protein